MSGFNPIIATASPHNAQLLYDLGATHFIDRKADVVAEVAKITSSPVEFVYDAVSLEGTQTAAWDLLAPNGLLILVLPALVDEAKYSDKKIIYIFGNVHAPPNRELGKSLYAKLNTLLAEGAIKVGIDVYIQAFDLMVMLHLNFKAESSRGSSRWFARHRRRFGENVTR